MLAAAVAVAAAASAPPMKPASALAPYPPMHWHSWNTFCAEDMTNGACAARWLPARLLPRRCAASLARSLLPLTAACSSPA